MDIIGGDSGFKYFSPSLENALPPTARKHKHSGLTHRPKAMRSSLEAPPSPAPDGQLPRLEAPRLKPM